MIQSSFAVGESGGRLARPLCASGFDEAGNGR